MTLISKDRWPLALWLISIALGLAIVAAVLRHVGLRHLERSAEVTAVHHAQVLAATVPGLPDLLQRGRLDARTVEQLRNLRRAGQVFRFKLFAQDGRQILVSDDLDKPTAGLAPNGAVLGDEHGARSAHVSQIVLSGGSFIELKDGAGKKDRPPAYSEAYVPLVRDGQVMGVVEVYRRPDRAQAACDRGVWHGGDHGHAGVRCAGGHQHRALGAPPACAAPCRRACALPRAARRVKRRAQSRQLRTTSCSTPPGAPRRVARASRCCVSTSIASRR